MEELVRVRKVIFVMLMVAFISGAAFASGARERWHFDSSNMSEEQISQLTALRDRAELETEDLRAELRTVRTELTNLYDSSNRDTSAIENALRRMNDIRVDLQLMMLSFHDEAEAIVGDTIPGMRHLFGHSHFDDDWDDDWDDDYGKGRRKWRNR